MLRYHQFVRLKASSYFLAGGDSEDLIQEGMVGLYKAVRDYREDRQASFRSFAELCITRQIITAIKTATRQKHVPLNGYLSFSHTPGDSGDDGECSLADVLPGSSVNDPVNQVISAEEVASLKHCLTRLLSNLESRVRLQDRRQCAAAHQAQGRPAPRESQGPAVDRLRPGGRRGRAAVGGRAQRELQVVKHRQ